MEFAYNFTGVYYLLNIVDAHVFAHLNELIQIMICLLKLDQI